MSINRSELNAAIPQPAMERLPLYLNYLKMRLAEGCEQISSAMIAQDLYTFSCNQRIGIHTSHKNSGNLFLNDNVRTR